MEAVKEILKRYWGYPAFRELQEEIIQSVLEGKDTLALMPTGGGKSLCYQVPALVQDGICIVVSPLIALMRDQVEHLQSRGIKGVAIYSGMSTGEIDVALDNCVHGHYKFLYVSPERLTTELMKVRARKMKVNLLAVDEAHCISQWGYDFRPPYLHIAAFRELLAGVPVIALTATATPSVVNDICQKLAFRSGLQNVFRKSFFRKNLSYSVLQEEDKYSRILKMLDKVKGTALIYVRNRRRTKELALFLQKHKVRADYYHAGLAHELRNSKQADWMQNKTRVMVCTNAFGMGIDKPDVRVVVHWDVPDNPEAYFQEAGRGGRDEKKSFAVLLYNHSDIIDLDERAKHGIPSTRQLNIVYQALANSFKLASGSGLNESFDFDLASFCKTYRLHPLDTYEALKVLEQEGYISSTEAVYLKSRVMMAADKEDIYRFEVEHKRYEPLLRMLLRTYSGVFEEFVAVNEREMAFYLKVGITEVETQLKQLHQFQLLFYEPRKDAPQIVFLQPRLDGSQLQFNTQLLKKRQEAHEQRLMAMKNYAEQLTTCRSILLLNYFGETDSSRCGICDVCLRRNRLDLTDLEFNEISDWVKNALRKEPLSIEALVKNTGKHKEEVTLKTVQFLLDTRELEMDGHKQLILRN